jgi:hypothetical protein
VIYRIYEEQQLVVVCAIGPRKQEDATDVYTQFQALAQTGKVARQIADVLGSLALGKKKSNLQNVSFLPYSMTLETPPFARREGWGTRNRG